MSSLSAAVLLLLLPAICVGQWRHWRAAVDKTPTPPLQCAANEAYAHCGARCEPACNPPQAHRHCPRSRCKPGCACKEGYLRDKASGECVTEDQCPAPPPLECAGGEVQVRCDELADADVNRRCPAYGDTMSTLTRGRKPRCGRWDERRGGRCACRMPLWVGERGSCVPKEQCPTCDTATEVFNDCGNLCERKCGVKFPTRNCSRMCAPPACACKRGYKRDKASGKCVTPDKCTGTAPESDARNPMNPWPRAIPISYSHV